LNSLVMARWNPAKRTWVTVSAPGGKPLANQRDGEPKSGK
jgi:hypothetical protein